MVEPPSIDHLTAAEVREEFVCRLMEPWSETEKTLRAKLAAITRQIWWHDPVGSSLPALSPDAVKFEVFNCYERWQRLLGEFLGSGEVDPGRWILLIVRLDRLRNQPPASNSENFAQLKRMCESRLRWHYEGVCEGTNSRTPLITRAKIDAPAPVVTRALSAPKATNNGEASNSDSDILVINAAPEDSPSSYGKKKSRLSAARRRRKHKQVNDPNPPGVAL